MESLLANPWVQRILAWLASWLFGKLSEAWQDHVAHVRVEAHVRSCMKNYADLVLKYDEIQDAGKLTEVDKENLRREKINLEKDLINNINRH